MQPQCIHHNTTSTHGVPTPAMLFAHSYGLASIDPLNNQAAHDELAQSYKCYNCEF
jgi:hypothetical protein